MTPILADWPSVDRLISPAGLVKQFALELEVEGIFLAGWVAMSFIYQFLLNTTSGQCSCPLIIDHL